MSKVTTSVSVTVQFTDQEAWDFAQFLKRASFSDYRSNAADDEEAHRMLNWANKVQGALAELRLRSAIKIKCF